MSTNTLIEWADNTWNPVTGCSDVSEGCRFCYAKRLSGTRLRHLPAYEDLTRDGPKGPVWNGTTRFNPKALLEPMKVKAPRVWFGPSMSDLFHEANPDHWIDQVFAVAANCWWHRFLILTKRPERIADWYAGSGAHLRMTRCFRNFASYTEPVGPWPLPNVGLGISAEDFPTYQERWPWLRDVPAAMRFVSYEPALGPLIGTPTHPRVWPYCDTGFVQGDRYQEGYCGTCAEHREHPIHRSPDWIIAGGETGPGARKPQAEWFREVRDDCVSRKIPFFFKQWGGTKKSRQIDGREWNQRPEWFFNHVAEAQEKAVDHA